LRLDPGAAPRMSWGRVALGWRCRWKEFELAGRCCLAKRRGACYRGETPDRPWFGVPH